MVKSASWTNLADMTPHVWFAYVDARLAAKIKPVTLNGELSALQDFVQFFAEQDEPICTRFLDVEPLKMETHLPRDLALDNVQLLLKEINADGASTHAGIQRMGIMDKAWFLLMLHSGLRSGEVRRLTLEKLDFPQKKARIEQSKGLKDRVVYLSSATIDALNEYLKVRGPTGTETLYVFVFRHIQLSSSYISQRLITYGERCGVYATPHQLRHTCATLLLNAGAPVLTVQTILGHKHVDTTLGYARLYDGTVAADYYRAMTQVENRFTTQDDALTATPSVGELLALVDSLQTGTLSESQRETVQALRVGIAALSCHAYHQLLAEQ
jgi:site-specific recombinase XerD